MNENGTKVFDPSANDSTGELIWLSDTLYDRFISKGVGAIIGECGTVNKNNLSSRIAWAKYFPVVFGDNGNTGIPVGQQRIRKRKRDIRSAPQKHPHMGVSRVHQGACKRCKELQVKARPPRISGGLFRRSKT